MTKISICIPTYNTGKYLRAAIDSVLAQDYSDFELVVCDNASTDDTPEICASYADPRMRTVRYEELVGQAENWNRCLRLATHDYVVLLHSDDELMPAFLARAASVLDAHPEVGLVHCAVQHINTDGSPRDVQRLWNEDRVAPEGELLRRLLLEGCVVNPAGVMVRRTAYEAVGDFTDRIVWGVDWHMWARIAMQFATAYVAEPLARYRHHAQSGTSGVMATARNGTDELWMMKDLFARMGDGSGASSLYPEAVRNVAHRTWCFAEEMCRQGFMPAARAGVRRALEIRPMMALEARVWALWAASYVGYGWFERVYDLKRRL